MLGSASRIGARAEIVGGLVLLGIAQEQQAGPCRLFAQWKRLNFPIVHDPINVREPYPGHFVPTEPPTHFDPYARCEKGCTHDLARGVTKEALLGGDGPYPGSSPLQPSLGAGGILNGLRATMPDM